MRQFFSGCLVAITPNLSLLPKKNLSHDFSSQQHLPSPLPIGHLLSKNFPVTVSVNFYMWQWKHVDRSMGTGAWGHEHEAWGPERVDGTVRQFISCCLLSKQIIDGDGTVRQFFYGCLLSDFFWWRQYSEAIFSFCLLSTRGQEYRDGTVWQFFSGCLVAITHDLSLLPKKN